jgi:cytochrome c-type biogenesis protein CcmH
MLIWILFALMTAGLLAAVLRPLLAAGGGAPRAHVLSSADVYRAQLAELEVERGAGRVAEAEYLAARAEIGRRLIKAASAEASANGAAGEGGAGPAVKKKLPWLAIVLTVAVPALALPFYLYLGHPDYPDQPLASRGPEVARARQIEQLTAELEAKLKSGKGDATGWMMLGRVKAQLGDADAAIDAYGHAITMLKTAGQSVPADLSVALGQAEMMKAGGQITPRAMDAFRAALAVEPKHVGARFFLAEGKAASGDVAGAAADYRALLADTPPDAPYRPMIEKRLGELEAAKR